MSTKVNTGSMFWKLSGHFDIFGENPLKVNCWGRWTQWTSVLLVIDKARRPLQWIYRVYVKFMVFKQSANIKYSSQNF